MPMEFGVPSAAAPQYPYARRMPLPMRAEGNLSYLEFIRLVKYFWEEAHPDIPIRPSQSSNYARYPVITYGLNLRKTHAVEPKKRYRETIIQSEDKDIRLEAQRYDNVITFTVITEGNPELCETIIEAFEDFMQEMTHVFKRLGVSEMFYSRRLPDRERTSADDDAEERSVSYLVVLEKIYATEVSKIEEIVVRARVMLANYYAGTEFWVFDPGAAFYASEHGLSVGDLVYIQTPNPNQDPYGMSDGVGPLPGELPDGISEDLLYQVSEVISDHEFKLQRLDGNLIVPGTGGMGVIYLASDMSRHVRAVYIDNYGGATPSY